MVQGLLPGPEVAENLYSCRRTLISTCTLPPAVVVVPYATPVSRAGAVSKTEPKRPFDMDGHHYTDT
jgi:hypothetical protein